MVDITEFETERCCDSLTIYTGGTPNFDEKVQITSLRGSHSSTPITVYGSYLWLNFRSDYSVVSQGFRAEINTIQLPGKCVLIHVDFKTFSLSS